MTFRVARGANFGDLPADPVIDIPSHGAGAGDATTVKFNIFYTIQQDAYGDNHIVVSLNSLWDTVCGIGRENRKLRLNNQVKKLFANVYGSDANADVTIKATGWQQHKWVPAHIALACLSSRTKTATKMATKKATMTTNRSTLRVSLEAPTTSMCTVAATTITKWP